jgi:hypothetical protein
MSDDLRKQIYLNFSQCETEELLEIWRANDRYEWSETTFDVIGEILRERGVEPPPQGKPDSQERKRESAVVREDQPEQHVVGPPIDEAVHEVPEPGDGIPDRPLTVIYAVYLASGAIALAAVAAVVRFAINLATSLSRALPTYPLLDFVHFVNLNKLSIEGTWTSCASSLSERVASGRRQAVVK